MGPWEQMIQLRKEDQQTKACLNFIFKTVEMWAILFQDKKKQGTKSIRDAEVGTHN